MSQGWILFYSIITSNTYIGGIYFRFTGRETVACLVLNLDLYLVS
jgi:hypothetical protein